MKKQKISYGNIIIITITIIIMTTIAVFKNDQSVKMLLSQIKCLILTIK